MQAYFNERLLQHCSQMAGLRQSTIQKRLYNIVQRLHKTSDKMSLGTINKDWDERLFKCFHSHGTVFENSGKPQSINDFL